jgi:hypothetical protein
MAYNVVILVQHYFTFAGRAAPESESEAPLLRNDDDGDRV